MFQKVIQQIPLDKIITGKQVRQRFDEESLKGLAQSLRENGQHEPIHVVPIAGERYSLITGGRRVRAMRKNGAATAGAIVENGELNTGDLILRQITENQQREALTPWELAIAIQSLMKEKGWNASQIAAKLGVANGTITKVLSVLSLSEAVQRRLRAGEIPATAAYELSRVNDVAAQDQLASRIANGELTRDGLSGAIKSRNRNGRAKKAPSCRLSRVTARLDKRRSVRVIAPNLDLGLFVGILESLLASARQAQADQLALDEFLKRLKNDRTKGAAEPAAQVSTPAGADGTGQEGIITSA